MLDILQTVITYIFVLLPFYKVGKHRFSVIIKINPGGDISYEQTWLSSNNYIYARTNEEAITKNEQSSNTPTLGRRQQR
jgi:hypothetical protein